MRKHRHRFIRKPGTFLPVSRSLSLIAALFGLAGTANLFPFHIHSLVYFGFHCTLLGIQISRRASSPHLVTLCTPYDYIAGGIGEIP